MKISFHRNFYEAIFLCSSAIVVFIIHLFTGFNLLYAHYYLAITGVISIYISYRNYAVVDDNGVLVRYGPIYHRNSLFLAWPDISHIDIGTSEMSWIQSVGGRVWISTKATVAVPALKIKLKTPLPNDLQTKISDLLGKYLFPPTEALNDLGDEVVIKRPPHGGYKRFIEAVLKITGKDDIFNKANMQFNQE